MKGWIPDKFGKVWEVAVARVPEAEPVQEPPRAETKGFPVTSPRQGMEASRARQGAAGPVQAGMRPAVPAVRREVAPRTAVRSSRLVFQARPARPLAQRLSLASFPGLAAYQVSVRVAASPRPDPVV